MALSTTDLRKLTTKTIQLNIESRKSNAVRNTFPEPVFPTDPLLSYVDKIRNHHLRISAPEEAVVGLKLENIKLLRMCLKYRLANPIQVVCMKP